MKTYFQFLCILIFAVHSAKCQIYCENIGGKLCDKANSMVLERSNPCTSYLQCKPDAQNILHWIKHFCPQGRYPSLNERKCNYGDCPYESQIRKSGFHALKRSDGYEYSWNSEPDIPWNPIDKSGCKSPSVRRLTTTGKTTTSRTTTRRTTSMKPKVSMSHMSRHPTPTKKQKTKIIPINANIQRNGTLISRVMKNTLDTTTILKTSITPETTIIPDTLTITDTTSTPETTTMPDTLTITDTASTPETTTVPDTLSITDTTSTPETETTTLIEVTTTPETTTLPETATTSKTSKKIKKETINYATKPPETTATSRSTAHTSTKMRRTKLVPINLIHITNATTISRIITYQPSATMTLETTTTPKTTATKVTTPMTITIPETTSTLNKTTTIKNTNSLKTIFTSRKTTHTPTKTRRTKVVPNRLMQNTSATLISRIITNKPSTITELKTTRTQNTSNKNVTPAITVTNITTIPIPTKERRNKIIPIHIINARNGTIISRVITNKPDTTMTPSTITTPSTTTTLKTKTMPSDINRFVTVVTRATVTSSRTKERKNKIIPINIINSRNGSIISHKVTTKPNTATTPKPITTPLTTTTTLKTSTMSSDINRFETIPTSGTGTSNDTKKKRYKIFPIHIINARNGTIISRIITIKPITATTPKPITTIMTTTALETTMPSDLKRFETTTTRGTTKLTNDKEQRSKKIPSHITNARNGTIISRIFTTKPITATTPKPVTTIMTTTALKTATMPSDINRFETITTRGTTTSTHAKERRKKIIPIHIINSRNGSIISRVITNKPSITTAPTTFTTIMTTAAPKKTTMPSDINRFETITTRVTTTSTHSKERRKKIIPIHIINSRNGSIISRVITNKPSITTAPTTITPPMSTTLPSYVSGYEPNTRGTANSTHTKRRSSTIVPIHIRIELNEDLSSPINTNIPNTTTTPEASATPKTRTTAKKTIAPKKTVTTKRTTTTRKANRIHTKKLRPTIIPIHELMQTNGTLVSRIVINTTNTKVTPERPTTFELTTIPETTTAFQPTTTPETVARPMTTSTIKTTIVSTTTTRRPTKQVHAKKRRPTITPLYGLIKNNGTLISRIITNPQDTTITPKTMGNSKTTTDKTTTTSKKTTTRRHTTLIPTKKRRTTKNPVHMITKTTKISRITTNSPNTESTIKPTPASDIQEKCSKKMEGIVGRHLFPQEENCQDYWECKWRPFSHQWMIINHTCDPGMRFVPSIQICVSGSCNS